MKYRKSLKLFMLGTTHVADRKDRFCCFLCSVSLLVRKITTYMRKAGYDIWFRSSMSSVHCFTLCMLPLGHKMTAVTPDITSTFKTRGRKQEWFELYIVLLLRKNIFQELPTDPHLHLHGQNHVLGSL